LLNPFSYLHYLCVGNARGKTGTEAAESRQNGCFWPFCWQLFAAFKELIGL